MAPFSDTPGHATSGLVKWSDDRGDWVRRAFVSRKDNVDVLMLTAPSKGEISCAVRLGVDPGMGLPKRMIFTTETIASQLGIHAKYAPKLDAGYEGMTRAVIAGGMCQAQGNTLRIDGAKSVLLLSRTAKYVEHCESHWSSGEIQQALAALPSDDDKLLQRHVAVHQPIYDRVNMDLGAAPADRAQPNKILLNEQKTSSEPVLALRERIFDAGCYYFLSSSNEDTPPDLLGIWTGDTKAGWGGYYHLDANLNLQVGGGNIGDLPEAMEGYFKINEARRADFETNAQKLLGCQGMVAGGNSPGPQSGLMVPINDDRSYVP